VLNLCVFTQFRRRIGYDASMLGFQEVARASTLTRSLEIPLRKADRDGSDASQGPVFSIRMVRLKVNTRA
jgi:hypothetical protein